MVVEHFPVDVILSIDNEKYTDVMKSDFKVRKIYEYTEKIIGNVNFKIYVNQINLEPFKNHLIRSCMKKIKIP